MHIIWMIQIFGKSNHQKVNDIHYVNWTMTTYNNSIECSR